VRITAQLIEAETGAHLWADRFYGSLEDVFELQAQVAVSVAGVIEPALQAAETARAANRPTSDLTAYDLYLRAVFYLPPKADAEGAGVARGGHRPRPSIRAGACLRGVLLHTLGQRRRSGSRSQPAEGHRGCAPRLGSGE